MDSTYLDRAEAAQYLTARGLRVSKNTLQKWVTVGGGPVYRRFGLRAVYLTADLDAWAIAKLTPPRCSSSKSRAAA
ncbi:MAG: helix-turn-helix domain-containing protein [Sulfuritalea sp.]|nr:helix-turn-helix domain-containing protein [Sulfuritalea sp.]